MKSNNHDIILASITTSLIQVQKNIDIQIDLFRINNKKYTGIRKDKGYKKWKVDVFNRFNNVCCVCLSDKKIVCHHLYSYKYYPELRTELNNGVCICNKCHELFNRHYSNVNTLDQFLEFRKLMKDEVAKKYLKRSLRILNGSQFISQLKKDDRVFKVLSYTFLKIIIVDNRTVYCSIG
jgi:hypothetical protein